MIGSDPIDSVGTVDGESGTDGGESGTDDGDAGGGWAVVAEHDGAAALVGAILALDPAETYTKNELSDASGVAYKTLYLDGTVEALVEVGLLEGEVREGEETQFRIATDSPVYEAAAAFGEAAADDA